MASPQSSLAGKVVLVTGAARRIGRGIALRLAAEGARVAIHYHRSEAEARRTAEECGGAELFRANLESVAEIARMFAQAGERLARLKDEIPNSHAYSCDVTNEAQLDATIEAIRGELGAPKVWLTV